MEPEEEKRDRLNRLEKKLYSRKQPEVTSGGRSPFEDREESGLNTNNWQDQGNSNFDALATKMSRVAAKKNSFIRKLFIVSILFFVIAAGVAAFVFWGGMNLVSSRNVDIEVIGPLAIAAGQEISFDINVNNYNNTDLESASLIVEYPLGTRSASDLGIELQRDRFELGEIKSGETYTQNIKAVIFGEKESVKQIKISLEYRVQNSSALFYKEKVHEFSISSAPVIITPTYPKEVNSNQEITFNIEIASNSKDKLEDFLVRVEYPFGFVFKESTPTPSYNENAWRLSSLDSGEKRNIKITGTIIGQDNEERVFRITAGTADAVDERLVAVPLAELSESILISKPFISVEVDVDNSSSGAVIAGGENFNTNLLIRNNLSERLFNVSVTATFSGGAFNELSVSQSQGGFFRSSSDSILWDKRSVNDFNDMGPGDAERLSFSMTPLVYENIPTGSNPEINMTIVARGERILESGSIEQVSTTETMKVILSTDLSLTSRVVRSLGNLENSGPIPPKVDVPTTYTIIWSIKNSFNQVSGAEVRAVLPSYVSFEGFYSPTSEDFSFDEAANEVVWRVGSILPNTGIGSLDKQVYFQLKLLPSTSQIGGAPTLLGPSRLVGVDKITSFEVSAGAPGVNTKYSTDPIFNIGNERVVP